MINRKGMFITNDRCCRSAAATWVGIGIRADSIGSGGLCRYIMRRTVREVQNNFFASGSCHRDAAGMRPLRRCSADGIFTLVKLSADGRCPCRISTHSCICTCRGRSARYRIKIITIAIVRASCCMGESTRRTVGKRHRHRRVILADIHRISCRCIVLRCRGVYIVGLPRRSRRHLSRCTIRECKCLHDRRARKLHDSLSRTIQIVCIGCALRRLCSQLFYFSIEMNIPSGTIGVQYTVICHPSLYTKARPGHDIIAVCIELERPVARIEAFLSAINYKEAVPRHRKISVLSRTLHRRIAKEKINAGDTRTKTNLLWIRTTNRIIGRRCSRQCL